MSEKSQKVILIADDDADLLFQLKIKLEAEGYAVIDAPGHKTTIQLIEEERYFDMAILDLSMEYVDSGLILSYKIKEKYPNRPIMILSSMVHELNLQSHLNNQDESSWMKADAVVQKGVKFEHILKEIVELIGAPQR